MNESVTIPQRLDSLKVKLNLSWKEVAEKLGLSVSMLMQIKAGSRNLGANSFFRLCEVERAAGLESGSLIEKTLVKAGLMAPRTEAEQEMFQAVILEKVTAIELACSELRAILTRQIKVEIKIKF